MFTPRTAAGLTIALLALPAAATAKPLPPPTDHHGGAGESEPFYYGAAGVPTSSLAGTTSPQDLRSPDAVDAARAGEIAKEMEHYERAQPAPQAASHSGDATPWPEIAFAGVVLLATAGGVVRARVRRTQRAAV